MIQLGSPRTKGSPILAQRGPQTVSGIDVSHYEPNVDWRQVRASGKLYASAKATDGAAGVDQVFAKHRTGARAAGLLFNAYHFFRFEQDPVAQAKHFMAVTGGVLQGELPPCLDVEWDKTSARYGEGHTMDERAAASVLTCLQTIKLLSGMTPIIYTSWPFFCGFSKPERFFEFPLWCPAYAVEAPKVPLPWNTWHFWQYTDHEPVPGVGKIDSDLFNGSFDDLRSLTRK